ncbi:MAG: bifunctional riboflavin kinase/FAD synthetase [Hyphomicrobiaceae bacterium]
MQTIKGFKNLPSGLRGSALAIGNFDGVHRGHQMLLAQARAAAQETCRDGGRPLAGAMVFEPHPREFFHPERSHFRLTELDQKLALFEKYGLDLVVVAPFDKDFASLDAAAFVRDILVDALGVRHIVIGYDFMFGRNRSGAAHDIKRMGAEFGFGVTVVAPVAEGGEVISSSAIRAEIAQGDVKGAAEMLGHWWAVKGMVVGGFKQGTGMGYPTANITLPRSTPLAYGIYAVLVDTPEGRHQGAAYLGTRPTFDNGPPVLEVFLFDFSGNLYDHEITVSFVEFIRPDQRFEGMEALIKQMDHDCAKARQILAAAPSYDL